MSQKSNEDKKDKKDLVKDLNPSSIEKLKNYLKKRIETLDENKDYRSKDDDEDVKLENILENQVLSWKDDSPGKKDEEEDMYIYVSSGLRDKSKWPNPSTYQILLDSEINNIVQVNVIQGSFPYTFRTITENNNKLRYSIFYSPVPIVYDIRTITIPKGNYSPKALALEIMIQLNLDIMGNQLTGILDPSTNTYVMDFSTGYVIISATKEPLLTDGVTNYVQFKVTYDESWDRLIFQLLTKDSNYPIPVQYSSLINGNFRLYMNTSSSSDDLFSLIGFEPEEVRKTGTLYFDSTYYLDASIDYNDKFGYSSYLDQR